MIKPKNADEYLQFGCGRCSKGGTEFCKVHRWTDALILLRSWVLESGLEENIKWGVPVYSYNGKNVISIGALNESCTLGFFKGCLLQDPEQILGVSGENTQDTRILKFKSLEEILQIEAWIKEFIQQALTIEKAGLKPAKKTDQKWELPEEMVSFFEDNADVAKAFERLTPGRQRSWIIFINGAKQSATKHSRLTKAVPLILQGKGMHD